MKNKLSVNPWLGLFAAVLIMIVPAAWLVAAFLAALVHELFHIVAILVVGGRIERIQIGPGGILLESQIPGIGRELIAALAGPIGSMLLLHVCHRFPRLAICGCIQGVFNLLPVYPLDGGRAVACCISWCCPQKQEKILKVVEVFTYVCCLVLSFGACFALHFGAYPFLMTLFLIIKAAWRKRPCKWDRIRVQ